MLRFCIKYFCLWVLLTFTHTVQAQKNFQPGYVVKATGDTLHGYIQSRGAARSSLLCRFRPNPQAPTTDYAPADLRTYAFTDGARYEVRLVPLPDSVGRRPDRLFFLEVLVSGKASLYVRRDGYDETHYYLRMVSAGSSPLLELENRVRRAVNSSEIDVAQPLYRKTLSDAFRDCFAVQPLLPTLDYSSGSLIGIVQRYNSYFDAPAVAIPVNKERQAHFSGGIVGGVAKTEVRFAGATSLHNGTFTTTASPVVGVFIASTLPALNKKLQLRLDVLYEQLHYTDSYTARDISTVEVREQAVIQFQSLRLPLQLRYSFGSGPVQPFLLGGFTASYLLSNTRLLRSEYTAGNALVVTNKSAFEDGDLRHYDVGVIGGAGVAFTTMKKHAISFEVRAEHSTGFVDNAGIAAPITRYAGLLSVGLF